MTDLVCTLGGFGSNAYDINDNGQVVGNAFTASASQAFLYSNGTMTDLGTLGGSNSNAFGINDDGQVVGDSDIASGAERRFSVHQRHHDGSGHARRVFDCCFGHQ